MRWRLVHCLGLGILVGNTAGCTDSKPHSFLLGVNDAIFGMVEMGDVYFSVCIRKYHLGIWFLFTYHSVGQHTGLDKRDCSEGTFIGRTFYEISNSRYGMLASMIFSSCLP